MTHRQTDLESLDKYSLYTTCSILREKKDSHSDRQTKNNIDEMIDIKAADGRTLDIGLYWVGKGVITPT